MIIAKTGERSPRAKTTEIANSPLATSGCILWVNDSVMLFAHGETGDKPDCKHQYSVTLSPEELAEIVESVFSQAYRDTPLLRQHTSALAGYIRESLVSKQSARTVKAQPISTRASAD